jgi:hypothetical protein
MDEDDEADDGIMLYHCIVELAGNKGRRTVK